MQLLATVILWQHAARLLSADARTLKFFYYGPYHLWCTIRGLQIDLVSPGSMIARGNNEQTIVRIGNIIALILEGSWLSGQLHGLG